MELQQKVSRLNGLTVHLNTMSAKWQIKLPQISWEKNVHIAIYISGKKNIALTTDDHEIILDRMKISNENDSEITNRNMPNTPNSGTKASRYTYERSRENKNLYIPPFKKKQSAFPTPSLIKYQL